MRKILAAVLACGCVFGAAHAGDRDDALAIIDQAIQAQGGADALAKARAAVRSGEGVQYRGDVKIPFTDELMLDLPDRWRISLNLDKKIQLTMAVSGGKGWEAQGGTVNDMGAERLKELREEMYVLWLETLTPLRKDGIDLAPIKDGGKTVGVKASSKGHTDVSLTFDPDTHLLAKVEYVAEQAGLKINKQELLSDYKEFDGVKLPTHLVETLGGKKLMELTSATYKFPSKPDDAAFAKP
jgi:zinc protease